MLIFLSLWEISARLVDSKLVLPAVSETLAALWDLLVSGELILALSQSIWLLIVGLFISKVIGFILGALVARSRTAYWMLNPYFSALFATPTIALVPLVLVWFGFGFPGRVIVVVLAAVVPIMFSVASGLRDDPKDFVDVARSFGVKGELALLFRVRTRAALPVLLAGAGLRIGAERAIVGVIIGEMFPQIVGLGGIVRQGSSDLFPAKMLCAVVVIASMGTLIVTALDMLEKRFRSWKGAT